MRDRRTRPWPLLIPLSLALALGASAAACSSDGALNASAATSGGLIVTVGRHQEVTEGEEVTLAGSVEHAATDATFTWRQTAGPTVALEDAATLQARFVAPAVTQDTVLEFELLVLERSGREAADHTTVLVLDANAPPTVDAGPDQTVAEGGAVTLAGSASDPDGQVVSVAWAQLAGPPVALDDATALGPRFTAPETTTPVVLTWRLTVTDDGGLSASDLVSVTVTPDNLPPTADAGPDQIAAEGDLVTLAGSASDPDGDVAQIAWTQLAGPAVTLSDPTALDATFLAPATPATEVVVLRLVVTDDEGAAAADVVSITVTSNNAPPVVDAGPGQSVAEGALVTLAGAASDPDGQVVGTAWTQVAGPEVALSDPGALEATFTAPATATALVLTFQLTATDDRGATAADVVSVAVTPHNLPPTADAGVDQTVAEGATVTLAGAASDPDGEVVGIEWAQLTGPPVTLSDTAALDATFTAPAAATAAVLTFQLTVTDDEGATASDWVLVTVWPSNEAPVAEAGADQVVWEETAVSLEGAAADSDGTIASVSWEQVSGPPVTLADPGSLQTTFTAPTTQTPTALIFRLTVVDDDGAAASDVVSVTVRPVNQAPVADAGVDQTVAEGATVTLAGAASDPDGAVASAVWTQLMGPTVTLSDAAALDPTFTAPTTSQVVTLVLQLTVTDDEGAQASDTVVVVVTPENLPPTVDAGSDQSAVGGDLVQLHGVASDPDGAVVRTTWAQVGGPPVALDDASALSPSFTAPDPLLPTVLTFELEAEDDEGAVAADQVQVQVAPKVPSNVPPQAVAGVDQIQPSGTTVTLSGGATDADGAVVSTLWSQVSGPPVTLADASALSTTFQAPVVQCAAALIFELTVTDDDGAQAVDRVTVVVEGVTAGSVSVGQLLDLDTDDGGLVTEGTVWTWGVATTGPGMAYTGGATWSTNPAGNYPPNAEEFLCLPPLDRAAVPGDLTFTWYAYHSFSQGDGVTLEGLDPAAGWVPLTDVEPAYDKTAGGHPAWGSTPPTARWWRHGARVPASLGDVVRLRFALYSNGSAQAAGAYLDDLRFDAEADDPDGDGLPGVLDEWLTYGTDPHVADTDGDGVSDGDEVAAGTDPLNPAEWSQQPTLTPGTLLDFEQDDGGLVPQGGLWAWGTPASGPGRADSGARVWATNLGGNYGPWEVADLYLPPVDLRGVAGATLSFRLWLTGNKGDGLQVQAWDEAEGRWLALAPAWPAYDGTDAAGEPAWRSQGYLDGYVTVAASLAAYDDQIVKLRLRFTTNEAWEAAGAYVDDLAVDLESSDPDGDGVPGVLGELLGPKAAEGGFTEPHVADTDGDGVDDGAEYAAGTDPTNPADYPSGPVLSVGDALDLESDAGGLATTGAVWEWGGVASGPGAGASGSSAWATNLGGQYAGHLAEYLYLPPLDLTTAVDPTLSFRLWMDGGNGDGVSLERFLPGVGWVPMPPSWPAYDAADAAGLPAWRAQAGPNAYVWVGVSLAELLGQTVKLRLALRTDGSWVGDGAYVDDVALFEETDDPDGDGLVGGLAEYATWGTDPGLADTDGDGSADGDEVAAGTDPLNPADYPGGPRLTPGSYLDFEADDGGLAPQTGGSLWERGAPGSGPGAAWSGSQVWGTNLTGNYPVNQDQAVLLPPADLTATSRPTLGFRLWMGGANGDGVGLDIQDADGAWVRLVPATPAYDSSDAQGVQAWRTQSGPETYVQVLVDLSAWAGALRHLRLVLRSDGVWLGPGAYVDDLSLDDEASDPDGDGLVGILDERAAYGTDPYRADTDGDGVDDGAEVGAGTDPLDPTSF